MEDFVQPPRGGSGGSAFPSWAIIVVSAVGVVFTCGCVLALSQCRRKQRTVRDELASAMVRPGKGATKAEIAVWERHHGAAPVSRTVMGQKNLRTKLRAAGTAGVFLAAAADGAKKKKVTPIAIRVTPVAGPHMRGVVPLP